MSFKLTESYVILEFLADVFPNSNLLPPVSDPTARARARFFMDASTRFAETPMFEIARAVPEALERLFEGLEKIQALLPDPDAADGGEFATGKNFTIADCAIVPILTMIELIARTDLGRFEPGTGKKLAEKLGSEKFTRLRRYQKAVWERESVKKVIDFVRVLLCSFAYWTLMIVRVHG